MSIYENFNGDFILTRQKFDKRAFDKFKDSLDELMSIVHWAKDYKEAICCFRHNVQECPKCEICGENSPFTGTNTKLFYNRFCRRKECISEYSKLGSNEESKRKKEATSLKNYGTKHPMMNKEVLSKRDKTWNEKYGGHVWKIKEVRLKAEETNLIRYGSRNASSSEEIKEKRRIKWLDIYGVDNPMKLDKTKEKRKQTWLENYGVEHHFQCEEVKERYRKTCLENLGVDNPLKSKEVWENIRNSLYENYGVYHNMHHEDTSAKANSSLFKTYISSNGNEYRLQGYEHFAIEVLESMNINFVNDRRSVGRLKFRSKEGKDSYYFPDFFLTEENIYLEVKSQYTFNKSIDKMISVFESNKDINIIIVIFNADGSISQIYDRSNFLSEYRNQNE